MCAHYMQSIGSILMLKMRLRCPAVPVGCAYGSTRSLQFNQKTGSPMISLMMQHLLPLATLLLLSIVPTETKVVTSVAQCNESFLSQTPPNIPGILEERNIRDQNRYKVICQTLENIRRFVTLYDTKNRIPVFSAAEYRGGGEGRGSRWKIEPQLDNINDNDNMIPADKTITYDHQAGKNDYAKQTEFDKGHLFPSSYRSEEGDINSTYTLTNAVPQRRQFNNGRWNMMEICVKCILDNYCINNDKREGFVVIGAQPGNDNPLNQRINIPSVLWSAFCCYSHSQNKWLASAHWGNNTDDGPKYLQTKTLEELQKELRIEAFPGTHCPNDTSVTELYSEGACKAQCRQK